MDRLNQTFEVDWNLSTALLSPSHIWPRDDTPRDNDDDDDDDDDDSTASHPLPTMSLARQADKAVMRHGLARPTRLATPTPALATTQFPRGFQSTTKTLLPSSSQFGGGSSLGGFGGSVPPSYFQRPSLPANTIVRFVPQQTAWIVERMGKYSRILEPGLAILSAITADNVTLELDGVLYTRVFDAYKASYGVEDAEYAISQLAQTTMRSEIGQLSLDHVLKERAALNTNITAAINEAAQAWGVTCLRYEIRDIHAPAAVVEAMHRQVTAERSKRAEILESEGQRQSAINIAEGKKQSVILASEALRAEQINRANGEAEAILLKANASAKGIDAIAHSISSGGASAQGAVSLSVAEKYVDAFGKLARESTAVVVPGNVGDIGGMIATGLSVFGKVGEAQNRTMAEKMAGQLQSSEDGSAKSRDEQQHGSVIDSMVNEFDNTANRK
ncbi:hypothetical protein PG989_013759 [Apiospora arundinis]